MRDGVLVDDFGVVHIRRVHHRTDNSVKATNAASNTIDSERLVLLPLPETALVARGDDANQA